MTLAEYARFDALGLAELVATKQVSPEELAQTAAKAIEAINPSVNAVVETSADRIDRLDERSLAARLEQEVPWKSRVPPLHVSVNHSPA